MSAIRSLSLVCLLTFCSSYSAASEVTVWLASGRVFQGRVHERSDANRLWMKFGGVSASILRPIDWSHVQRARVGGEMLTAEQLQAQIPQLLQAPKPPRPLPAAAVEGKSYAERAGEALGFAPAVRSLEVEAWLENLDRDADLDGLAVYLAPRDRHGRLAAASGIADIELYGVNADPRGSAPERIGRWRVAASQEQLAAGAPLRISLDDLPAGWRRTLRECGELRVRLTLPGQGVFAASERVRLPQN